MSSFGFEKEWKKTFGNVLTKRVDENVLAKKSGKGVLVWVMRRLNAMIRNVSDTATSELEV